jgi:hypothetical protein
LPKAAKVSWRACSFRNHGIQIRVSHKNSHTLHGKTDLVVNLLVQVLDENVPSRALPQGRVPLAPHDPARTPLDQAVVEAVEGPFAVGTVEVVDVGVSERTTGDGVSADSDARSPDGTSKTKMRGRKHRKR